MLRLKCLTAACLLALTIGPVNATTFDWTLSGDPQFGITGHGVLTATQSGGQYLVDSISGIVSDTCAGGPPCEPQYRNIIALLTPGQPYGGLTNIGGDNLIFSGPAPNFVDSSGIVASIDNCPFGAGCYIQIFYAPNPYGGAPYFTPQDSLYFSNAGANPVDFELTAVSTTPLPAALPLFAGGLGVLGWLARRRKRTSAVVLAAA